MPSPTAAPVTGHDRHPRTWHRQPTQPTSNLGSCNIGCFEPDAFNFTGAGYVTAVDIQANNFAALPEALLSSMPALQSFDAQSNTKLATLPNQFFSRQGQLQSMTFAGSTNFGSTERLPDGLWRGLTSLTSIYLAECRYQNLPDMSDLTVRLAPRRVFLAICGFDGCRACAKVPWLILSWCTMAGVRL